MNREQFEQLVEDISAIITETSFNRNWDTITLKWNIGDCLFQVKEGVSNLLTQVSEELNISERELWRCLKFRKAYPDKNVLPERKSISWHKIANELLPDEKIKEPCEHKILICVKCRKRFENAKR